MMLKLHSTSHFIWIPWAAAFHLGTQCSAFWLQDRESRGYSS